MKMSFTEWLKFLNNKYQYSNYKTSFDIYTKTIHFKWIGK